MSPLSALTISLLFLPLLIVPVGSASNHPGLAKEVASSAQTSSGPYVTTFHISRNSSDFTPFVISPSGNNSAWVVMVQTRNGKPPIAQLLNFTLTPGGANWTYALPSPMINIPSDILYDQTAQTTRVWLLENDSLAYYNPTSHNITIAKTFLNDSPQYMTLDKGGNVWLTLLASNRIAEFLPENSTTRFYNAPSQNSALQGIAVAPDGSVWFAETIAKKIGHLIPCSSPPCNVTDYGPPPNIPVSFPIQVAVDRNGTVWFTDHGSNQFGSFKPSTGQWNTLPIGYCSEPYNPECAIGLPNAISVDSNGLVWFSEHFAGRIAKYDPGTGLLTEYVVPATETPYTWWMQPGPGNRVWFTSFGIGDIGYVNSTVAVPFSLSTPSSLQVARGSSTNLQANFTNPITRISLGSSSTSYDTPPGWLPVLSALPKTQQVDPSQGLNSATFTISAAWNASLGERNFAITEYDGYVNINSYVRINVVEGVYNYAPPIAAATVGIGTAVLYWQYSGRQRKPRVEGEDDSEPIRVQSQ